MKPSDSVRHWTRGLEGVALTFALVMLGSADAQTRGKKPNILILWGDDIGDWNVSAYNQGMMGYKTPNIDRLAREGALFTDWYGEQSCTAGRAAFITGQVGFRTGLLKVGLPGVKEGLQKEDVTIAEQRAHGFDVWREPFVPLRLPKLFNLRSGPFETADHEGMDYERWAVEHLFVVVPAQQYVGQFLATFREFPPRQKPGTFSIDQALASLREAGHN